jgi:hypothetical protein
MDSTPLAISGASIVTAEMDEPLAGLREVYLAAFGSEIDSGAFERDDFYAFQVLGRAVSEGPRELKQLAENLQAVRFLMLDEDEILEVGATPAALPAAAKRSAAAVADAPIPVPERRGSASRSTGHVRLGNREIVVLSQMRIQYRRAFGMFFDSFEFTGNDLYARALLASCVGSGNHELAASARQFLNDDGAPRFHRRLGRPDFEIRPPEFEARV